MWILPVYLHGFICWDASSRPKTLKQTIKTVEKKRENHWKNHWTLFRNAGNHWNNQGKRKYQEICSCMFWMFSLIWFFELLKKIGKFCNVMFLFKAVKNQQIEYSDNRGYFGTTVKMQKTSKTKELCVWRKNYAVHWASKGIGCEWIHMI